MHTRCVRVTEITFECAGCCVMPKLNTHSPPIFLIIDRIDFVKYRSLSPAGLIRCKLRVRREMREGDYGESLCGLL